MGPLCVVPVMHCPALLEEHRRQAERVTCYIGHGSQTHWCVKITAPLTQLGQLHTSVSTATHTPSDLKHTHAHYTYTHHFSNICVNALSQHVMCKDSPFILGLNVLPWCCGHVHWSIMRILWYMNII